MAKMRGASLRVGILAALATASVSVGYAALSAGLTTGDLKTAGDQLSAASWNRMVNSVLELDQRTSVPVVTKVS